MNELGNINTQPKKRWPVASILAALLGAAVLCQPDLAHAAHGGGVGFHGCGFGGFHGGEFHGDAYHGGAFHGGVAALHNGFGGGGGDHWEHGWRNGRYGWGWGNGLDWSSYPDAYGWG